MSELESIIIETNPEPNAAVVWLHGLGADGSDFVPLVEQMQLPADMAIRFIFHNAPIRPITINQGYPMPGWYDISNLSIDGQEDADGIRESSAILKQLCRAEEKKGIRPERIVMAGFSQGGAIALHCGCRYPDTLAGIMALSTYLPLPKTLDAEISEAAKHIPVFMAHGRQDDVVAPEYGKISRDRLEACGMQVEWHEYDMAHTLCMEEIIHIRQWLMNIL